MPRSQATRPYRIATMTVFVGFSTLYVSLVARGLVVSLMHREALPVGGRPVVCRAVEQCGQDLRDLRAALDSESSEVERTGTQAERRWDDWSVGWQRDLAALRAACCLDGDSVDPARAPLDRASADVLKLGRLYGTHLVQYAREIGPQAERCANDLAVMGGQSPRPPPVPTP